MIHLKSDCQALENIFADELKEIVEFVEITNREICYNRTLRM